MSDNLCECCGKNEAIGVASTSMPISVRYCRECAIAGRDPYWVLVSNTACCNGLENTNEHWQKHVKKDLEFYGKSIEEFNKEVANCIKEMKTMQ